MRINLLIIKGKNNFILIAVFSKNLANDSVEIINLGGKNPAHSTLE